MYATARRSGTGTSGTGFAPHTGYRLGFSDFFRQKYGATAEIVSSLILIPSYFGWVAAQLVALAGILDLFFGIPPSIGLPLVAVIGTGYMLMGGMWSVTLTDAAQILLVLGGLIVLAVVALGELGVRLGVFPAAPGPAGPLAPPRLALRHRLFAARLP